MEEIFKKIEDNIFETQEENKVINGKEQNEETTTDTVDINKKEKKKFLETEQKNRQSKIHLEKPEELENKNEENEKNDEKNKSKILDDDYSDYRRVDKTGIHFQIISDFNASIEFVPEDLFTEEVKSLILKYKGVYDEAIKLWVIPYVNYQPLYEELCQIEEIKYNLHKIGSIAKECFEKKTLTKISIKRKKEEEIIDYTNDTRERKVEQLPEKIQKILYDFQIEGINFGIEHHCRFLLADEMGVGKTIQAISLSYIYRDSWPVLIVCPGSMKYLWKGEIRTWLGLKDHRVFLINSSRQKISSEAYFYIISYDLIKHILKKLKQMTFDFVILDEAHSIKNKDSLRAKNILPIAIRAKRLILMTGTPLLAKPLESYPLLYALRPDIFCYFKKFAYRYCDPQPTPLGMSWSGASNTKELHWILSTLMVRRLKKEVLNRLPPKRRQKVVIKTDPKLIDEIKLVRTIEKGRKGTLDAYTLTSKAKIEGVYEFISDLLDIDEKFIIFGYHHEMLDRMELLMKEKNIEYIRIDGNTKQDMRYEYVNNFQRNENCKVAILSIIAASTGITLTSARLVVFAELTWTPSIMIQAEDRAHRIGQKSEFVDIKYLYGPETLDDFILDKLQKKLTIVSTTLDDKKEILGVKADPNLINVEYDIDLYEENNENEEQNYKNLEKKMLDDLDLDSNIDTTDNKKKKTIKKKRKNKKNKSVNKTHSKNKNNEDYEDLDKLRKVSISKNKPKNYPKETNESTVYTDPKKENVSKISGIKELRKRWTLGNKAKSVNKFIKIKKMEQLNSNNMTKSILTLINDNKKDIKKKLDNIKTDKNKMDLFANFNEKENIDENINLNINVNSNHDFREYEKDLSINLHTKNMRRTPTQYNTKESQNALTDLMGTNEQNNLNSKTVLFSKDKNEYLDKNVNQNMIDKVLLI